MVFERFFLYVRHIDDFVTIPVRNFKSVIADGMIVSENPFVFIDPRI